MKRMKFIPIFAMLVFASATAACDPPTDATEDESAVDLEAEDEPFDMSLLIQDKDGEWYAPIGDTPNQTPGSPRTHYSMHNHFQAKSSNNVAWWHIHRDGFPDGSLCAPANSFAQHCINIAAYVGAKYYGWYDGVQASCPAGQWVRLTCQTY